MFFCNVAIAASSKAALKQSYFSKKCTHVNLQLSKKKQISKKKKSVKGHLEEHNEFI